MSRPYIPGIWATKYEQLPPRRKDEVNTAVNQLLAQETGVARKLDPRRDMELVRRWLCIRDAVMEWLSLGKTLQSAVNANEVGLRALSSSGHFALDLDGHMQFLPAAPKVSARETQVEFSVDGEMSQELFGWVNEFVQGRRSPRSVVLVHADSAFRVVSTLSFASMSLEKVAFPNADATSKQAGRLTLSASARKRGRPENDRLGNRISARTRKGTGGSSDFRLEISGLETDRVVKVDPVIFGRRGPSDLVLTAPATALPPFTVAFSHARRTSGALHYLASSQSDPIVTLSFGGLSPAGELRGGGRDGMFQARFTVSNASLKR